MSATDRDIVDDVRRGESNAFGQLVEKYQSRLFSVALMMVRERSGAEEVAQDAFVRAYTNLHRYDDERPFYPWLVSIAARLAQNWLRRHLRTERREGAALADVAEPTASNDALGALVVDERSCRLWREVSALSSGERTAVFLYYRDGMTVGEIAHALGVSSGTVKTFLFRARRRLRERLAEEKVL